MRQSVCLSVSQRRNQKIYFEETEARGDPPPFSPPFPFRGWLGSRVVSVLEFQAQKARVQIAAVTLSGNSLRQTVHTRCASVHQAAKLIAALLRVARVTAGLAESNGSLPPGL